MSSLTRRLFLGSTAGLAGAAATTRLAVAQESGAATVSVEEALRRRESIRAFTGEALEENDLLRVLWAAAGVNRPDVDGRTAPSWRHALDIEIYVATAGGVHRYDPAAEALEEVSGEDLRGALSSQPFVGTAPAVLVYVSDRERLAKAARGADEAALAAGAQVNSAVMAQNVYLYCAAAGLGTCLVGGGIDREAVAAALSLSGNGTVTYVQPVGHPDV